MRNVEVTAMNGVTDGGLSSAPTGLQQGIRENGKTVIGLLESASWDDKNI